MAWSGLVERDGGGSYRGGMTAIFEALGVLIRIGVESIAELLAGLRRRLSGLAWLR